MPIPHYDFAAMQLRVDYARAALVNSAFLERAFIWDRSPQGRDYWERQVANGLDLEGRSTLAFMAAQAIAFEIQASFVRRAA